MNPIDRFGSSAELACRGTEAALRRAQQAATGRDEYARGTDRQRLCEIAGQRRESTPTDREPRVGMQSPIGEFEVVCEDEEGSDHDQRGKPRGNDDRPGDADADRAGERHDRQHDQQAA